jgi:hypothetical protein
VTLRANLVPAAQFVNRLRVALREWVMNGTLPPPSRWPLMHGPRKERNLVEPTKADDLPYLAQNDAAPRIDGYEAPNAGSSHHFFSPN